MVEAVLWADSPVFELNPRVDQGVDQGTDPRSALWCPGEFEPERFLLPLFHGMLSVRYVKLYDV